VSAVARVNSERLSVVGKDLPSLSIDLTSVERRKREEPGLWRNAGPGAANAA